MRTQTGTAGAGRAAGILRLTVMALAFLAAPAVHIETAGCDDAHPHDLATCPCCAIASGAKCVPAAGAPSGLSSDAPLVAFLGFPSRDAAPRAKELRTPRLRGPPSSRGAIVS